MAWPKSFRRNRLRFGPDEFDQRAAALCAQLGTNFSQALSLFLNLTHIPLKSDECLDKIQPTTPSLDQSQEDFRDDIPMHPPTQRATAYPDCYADPDDEGRLP